MGGACFGSMAFPEEFTKADTTEVYYLPSFGVGCLLMIIVDMAVLSLKLHNQQKWYFEECFIPGAASGIVWCMGFLAILYAEMVKSYIYICLLHRICFLFVHIKPKSDCD